MGMKRKIKLGNWFTPAFRMLYALKGLRGTAWDLFGYVSIRREERRLIGWYRDLIQSLLPALTHENHSVAVALAGTPNGIRGFEAVKERTIAETEAIPHVLFAVHERIPQRDREIMRRAILALGPHAHGQNAAREKRLAGGLRRSQR